jgi:hydroxymethylglutaryl-CoA lyase
MIRLFEVGPRDGLQNEKKLLTIDQKLDLIEGLAAAGLKDIEVGAFVRPDRVPQMAGTDEIYRSVRFHQIRASHPDVHFWSLVPNEKGLERAAACGATNIAVFGGATETFVQKNIGMSVDESLGVFNAVAKNALQLQFRVRGYISVCWICPYEGDVKPEAVLRVAKAMLDMGIENISLGDTIGRAHPDRVEDLLQQIGSLAPPERFGVHFHDTYGMAIANIDRAVRLGYSLIDSSIGGLGGCPYAPGASGNVATEDVYSLLQGYKTEKQTLDIKGLLDTAVLAQDIMGHLLPSKRLAAYISTSRA